MIANHGRIDKYEHEEEEIVDLILQASILNVKLNYLDVWINKRNNLAHTYFINLKNCNKLILPYIEKDVRHAFHLFVIRTKYRDNLKDYLNAKGIQTGIHYPISLPMQKAYQKLGITKDTEIANNFANDILSLPIGEHLETKDIEFVCSQVLEFFK